MNKKNLETIASLIDREALLNNNLKIAMLANIAVETGYTFDFTIRQRGRANPAYGLFQFDPLGGLYGLYQEYLEYLNIFDSAESQLNMMVDILLGTWPKGIAHVGFGNVRKVRKASQEGAVEATRAFSDYILRPGKPHMERRIAAIAIAKEALENNAAPQEQPGGETRQEVQQGGGASGQNEIQTKEKTQEKS